MAHRGDGTLRAKWNGQSQSDRRPAYSAAAKPHKQSQPPPERRSQHEQTWRERLANRLRGHSADAGSSGHLAERHNPLKLLARPRGFEPLTFAFGGQRSTVICGDRSSFERRLSFAIGRVQSAGRVRRYTGFQKIPLCSSSEDVGAYLWGLTEELGIEDDPLSGFSAVTRRVARRPPRHMEAPSGHPQRASHVLRRAVCKAPAEARWRVSARGGAGNRFGLLTRKPLVTTRLPAGCGLLSETAPRPLVLNL